MNHWQLFNQVVAPVNTKFGAPMGRANVGTPPPTVTTGRKAKQFKKHQPKIYVKRVPLTDGYDKGGAYWGIGKPLFVEYTPDLSYVYFFREGEWHRAD